MTTTTTPITILEQAQEFQDRLTQRKAATEKARNNLKAVEDNLIQAKRSFSQASAAHLSCAEDRALPSDLTEHQALASAHTALEEAKLAWMGCQTAEAREDPSLLLPPLREALAKYQAEQIKYFLEIEVPPAARAYTEMIRRGQALASALGVRLGDPESSETTHNLAQALQVPPSVGAWRADPSATAIFEQHRTLHSLLTALERHQSQRENTAKQAYRNPPPDGAFNVHARYRVNQPLRLNGVDFPIGKEIAVYDLGPGGDTLLSKLYGTGKVRLLTESELLGG